MLPTIVTLGYFVLAANGGAAVQQLVYAGGKVVQFALPAAWILLVLRQKPRLKWGDRSSLLLGAAFGLLVLLTTWFGYGWLAGWEAFQAAMEPIQKKVADLEIDSPGRFLAVGIFYALIHSLLEEYYWRWFVFGRLNQHTSPTVAVVISALGFTLHHIVVLASYFAHAPALLLLLCLSIFVGGVFWAWLYRRSGSLLGPWIGHLLVDAGIFAVGYRLVFAGT